MKYIYRWLLCKIFKKHHWQYGLMGWLDLDNARRVGPIYCQICGKGDVIN